MGITDLLAIPIVGVALSLVMEWVKSKYGTSKFGTKAITIGASLAIGGAFYFLNGTVFWQGFVGVLGVATVVWAYFLNNEKPSNQI